MKKYIRKMDPVIALKWTGENTEEELKEFFGPFIHSYSKGVESIVFGTKAEVKKFGNQSDLYVKGSIGYEYCNPGDYVIHDNNWFFILDKKYFEQNFVEI